MKKYLKVLKIVLVNLLVFVILLELVSLLVFFTRHKGFFYTSQPAINETIEQTTDKQLTAKRFHPFFGYTHTVNSGSTNNYGFNCPIDFPFKKDRENLFVIGIFGGSVANDFYLHGREQLTRRLVKHPELADKEMVYLNYSLGGYKQPQQMQILNYFLAAGQELDMVLNIDGFNEMVFCVNNNRLNVDIAMPSAQHFLPMRDLVDQNAVTGEKLEVIYNIQKIKKDFARTKKRAIQTPLASLWLIYSAYNKYLYKQYRGELVHFDSLIEPAKPGESLINVKQTDAIKDESLLLSGIASLWANCSLTMHSAVTARGGLYFHFIQPNQYFTKKSFTDEEQQNAIDPNLPYNRLVRKGYPVLLKEQYFLQQKGVGAYSAVGIFSNRKETIYIDKCCHFNPKGCEILADFMADQILKSI